jgi:hypothetical protein
MHHVVGGGAFEVGERHVEEVLLLQQHAGAGIVDVEKTLQVGEGVGGSQGLHAWVGQLHAIALRQAKDHLRLERTLDVDVQLGLGHALQQRRQCAAGDGIEVDHGHTLAQRRFNQKGHPAGGLCRRRSERPSG